MQKNRWTGLMLLGVFFLWLVGCQTTSQGPRFRSTYSGESIYQEPAHDISIHELARQLGLRVTEINGTYITLKDEHNTVLVFSYHDAQFYVNGKPEGKVGKTKELAGVLQVEAGLVHRIQSCLETSREPSKALTQKQSSRLPRGTIVVDAGHGGKDPGAISVLGFPEKDINLAVARDLGAMLKGQGFNVIYTRDTDCFVSLEDRVNVANGRQADLFVSIHADTCATPSVTGFTVYTAHSASFEARKLAHSVEKALLSTGSQSRGVREADYRVLVQTRCPAILVELGYLSNYWEARRLRDKQIQKCLASAIASGTTELYGGTSVQRTSSAGATGRRSSQAFAYPSH